jgi:multidrug resistance efflux pump
VLGSGLAARSVTLCPAVAGEVAELNFKAGQRVQAGQVL